MNLNSRIIKKNSKVSFLVCKKDLYRFYMKNGWRFLNQQNSQIMDHKSEKKIMYFNSKMKPKNLKIYLNK